MKSITHTISLAIFMSILYVDTTHAFLASLLQRPSQKEISTDTSLSTPSPEQILLLQRNKKYKLVFDPFNQSISASEISLAKMTLDQKALEARIKQQEQLLKDLNQAKVDLSASLKKMSEGKDHLEQLSRQIAISIFNRTQSQAAYQEASKNLQKTQHLLRKAPQEGKENLLLLEEKTKEDMQKIGKALELEHEKLTKLIAQLNRPADAITSAQ